MHVSLLVPSRGPILDLHRLITSALAKAKTPRLVEFVIRADHDDPALGERLDLISRFEHTSAIVGPRWRGYDSASAFHEQCAALALGGWLLILDDDAEFIADGWDARLPITNKSCAAHFGPSVPFWAVSRGWFDMLGRHLYARCRMPCDQWLTDVITETNTPVVDVDHGRYIAHHYKPRERARVDGSYSVSSPSREPDELHGTELSREQIAELVELWNRSRS